MPPLVELRGVSWSQGGRTLLSNVDWSIRPGERWAVLGPNGAGKSSLLRVACGYVWPTGGSVLRGGSELVDLQELRRSIGWVSQELARQIPPQEVALDTVVSGHFAQTGLKRFGRGAGDGPLRERAATLLAETGCEGLAGKRFGVLSHGERQQVLVARARMAEPVLVVLDEPCGGMDPGVRERFLAWLQRFCEETPSLAVVLVTHHVEEVMPAFTRMLHVDGGRAAACGRTSDLILQDRLQSLYGLRLESIESSGGRWYPRWGESEP